MTNNITSAFYDIPPFKVVCVVLNGISHIDFIGLFSAGQICAELGFFLPERYFVLVQICDSIFFEKHRIIGNRRSVRFRRKHTAYLCSDPFNRKRCCRWCIIFILRPTAEIYPTWQLANSRIIEYLLHFIHVLYIHGSNLFTSLGAVRFNEFYKHSGVFTCLYYDID